MTQHTFFVHIGKCGGMSIRQMLQQHYGVQNSYDVVDIFTKWNKNKTTIPSAFYGHATYTLSEILPKPLYVFTMLRNPAERVFSYWKHMTREGPEIHHTNAHLLAMNFTDAIQHPDFNRLNNGMVKALSLDLAQEYKNLYQKVYYEKKDFTTEHNKISRHLNNSDAGIDRCYCDEHMLEVAKNHLDIIKFGFQERFEEGIRHVFEPIGYVPKMVETNTAPKSQQSMQLTEEQYDLLRQTNTFDFQLYEYAQQLYKDRLKLDD